MTNNELFFLRMKWFHLFKFKKITKISKSLFLKDK